MVVLPYSGPLSVSAWQQALSGIGRGFHTGADRAQVEPKQRPINAFSLFWPYGKTEISVFTFSFHSI